MVHSWGSASHAGQKVTSLTTTPERVRASLERVRASGEPIAVEQLACEILALRAPVARSVARRVVATALGLPEASLPDEIAARHVRPAEEVAVTDRPLADADFVVVDLETTGLSPETARILEIAAVRVRALEPAGKFESLVRPPGPLSHAIADLTGIDDAMVADAPDAHFVLRGFLSWFERTGPAPFVAHNARFDAGFVKRALEDVGLPPLAAPVLCTQKLARRAFPEVGRYNLDHLCAHFGIGNRARHRALGDARATATLLIELLDRIRTRDGVETVGELLDYQDRPIRRKRTRRRPTGSSLR
jgi:DNA polymerase III epsilon subunit family exonuclease